MERHCQLQETDVDQVEDETAARPGRAGIAEVGGPSFHADAPSGRLKDFRLLHHGRISGLEGSFSPPRPHHFVHASLPRRHSQAERAPQPKCVRFKMGDDQGAPILRALS